MLSGNMWRPAADFQRISRMKLSKDSESVNIGDAVVVKYGRRRSDECTTCSVADRVDNVQEDIVYTLRTLDKVSKKMFETEHDQDKIGRLVEEIAFHNKKTQDAAIKIAAILGYGLVAYIVMRTFGFFSGV